MDFDIRAGVLVKYNGSATNVIIPDSVKEIESEVFASLKYIEQVTIPEGVEVIGNNTFSSCVRLTNIDIPLSVKVIGDNAFSDCVSLTSIDIPPGVEKIGSFVFFNCIALTHASIPASVTSIDPQAFVMLYTNDFDGTSFVPLPSLLSVDMMDVQWEKFYDLFPKAEGAKPYIEKRRRRYRLQCQHCGGEFTLFGFGRKCKSCGIKKDYSTFI